MEIRVQMVTSDSERTALNTIDFDANDSGPTRTLAAWSDDQIIGAINLYSGAEAIENSDFQQAYELDRFVSHVRPQQLLITGAPRVSRPWRDHPVAAELLIASGTFATEHGVRLIFTSTEPGALQWLRSLGFLSYRSPYQDPERGWLIPLVLDLEDTDYLTQIDSPLFPLPGPRSPMHRRDLPHRVASRSDWARLYQLFRDRTHLSFLQNLSEPDLKKLLNSGHVVELDAGEALIRQGETGGTVFLILAGTLEIRIDGKVVGVQVAGDVIGEIAFLLETERTADVWAVTADVRALQLSNATLNDLMQQDPTLAAGLSIGLARALCWKLVRTTNR